MPLLRPSGTRYLPNISTRRALPCWRGETFSWHDDKDAPPVAVVNRRVCAQNLWLRQPRHWADITRLRDGTRVQVVGIVEDGKYANLAEDPQPAMFLPILQSPASDTWLVVRSNRDPQQLAAAIRKQIAGPGYRIAFFIETWNEEMNGALFRSAYGDGRRWVCLA